MFMRLQRSAALAAVALLPLLAGGFVLQATVREHMAGAELFDEVLARVAREAVDSIPSDSLYAKAARGLVNELDDPYADLYSPAELAGFNRNTLKNSYGGVGMQIEDQAGVFTITTVFPNTPAAAARVSVGDRIETVEGAHVAGLKLEEVTRRLLGVPGTGVRVTFSRNGVSAPIEARFIRARVHVPAVPYAVVLSDRVGYVPLVRFNDTSAEDVARAVLQLRAAGARAFILDMRGNPGGSLEQSVEIGNLFLKPGQEVVQVRYRNQPNAVHKAAGGPIIGDAPLAVLVDEGAASAAEIVAGALQDHDRAVIVGTTSFGKGLVQSLYTLPNQWGLKLTTGKWYTPSGRSIQKPRKKVRGQLVEETPDSLETDSVRRGRPVFRSDAGRPIYGGGGITPDVIVPADTLSRPEQNFLRALAPKSQASHIALYQMALRLRDSVDTRFSVRPEWRDRFWGKLQLAGVEASREQFDSAGGVVDRLIERQIASVAFGDSTAFRRSVQHDSQLLRALELIRRGRTQADLLAALGAHGAG
jgi:carboxyl-terminal processing protease